MEAWKPVEAPAPDIIVRVLDVLVTADAVLLLVAAALGALFTVGLVEVAKKADGAWPSLFNGPRWREKLQIWAFVIGTVVTVVMAEALTGWPTVVCLVTGFIAGWRAPWLNDQLDRWLPGWNRSLQRRVRQPLPPMSPPTLEPPAGLPPDDPGPKPRKVLKFKGRRR